MKKLLFSFLALGIVGSATVEAFDYNPALKCRERLKKKSACDIFPNLSLKKGFCRPQPEIVGSIEWCRKDITRTELDECGKPVTYDATVVTYRYVYCNGGWGECFTRIYKKGPLIIEPPLAKNVVTK